MTSIVKNLNVDEKVGYLFRYRSLLRRIDLINDELLELDERRKSLQSISIIQISKNSKDGKDRMTKSLIKIDKSYHLLMDKIDEATDTLDEIYAAIDSIEYNEVGKNILICRYIKEMTFEAIGEELGYSCAHIRRLHKKVIDVLEIQKT